MAKAPSVTPRSAPVKPTSRIRPKAIKARPALRVFNPVKNPLPKVTPAQPGEMEASAKEETDTIIQALQDNRTAETNTLGEIVSTGYYAVIVFDEDEQMTAFLEAIGVRDVGAMYLDGREIADKLGIAIPESRAAKKPAFKPPSKRMRDLVHPDYK